MEKTEKILSSRAKRHIPTGMTHRLAGISSTTSEDKPKMVTHEYLQLEQCGLRNLATSPLGQNVIIRKINGFSISPNDENVQASLRTSLDDSSFEVSN